MKIFFLALISLFSFSVLAGDHKGEHEKEMKECEKELGDNHKDEGKMKECLHKKGVEMEHHEEKH
jgi:hypothetical protein